MDTALRFPIFTLHAPGSFDHFPRSVHPKLLKVLLANIKSVEVTQTVFSLYQMNRLLHHHLLSKKDVFLPCLPDMRTMLFSENDPWLLLLREEGTCYNSSLCIFLKYSETLEL